MENKDNKPRGIAGAYAAPALMIVIIVLFAAANLIDVGKITGNMNPYLSVAILEIVCLGLPTVFFCILRGSSYKGKLRLHFLGKHHLTVMLYALVIMACIGMAMSLALYWLFPEPFAASATGLLESGAAKAGGYDGIYAILCFCVIPAILEELLIRGVILAEYSVYGAGVSVFLSALMFSMLHFSPVRLPIYFACGIILAMLALMTNSIIASAIVHVLYNVFSMYFENYIYKLAGKSSGGLVLLMFIVVTLLLVSLVLFFRRGKILYRYKAEDNEPSPMRRIHKNGDSSNFVAAISSIPLFIVIGLYIIIVIIL